MMHIELCCGIRESLCTLSWSVSVCRGDASWNSIDCYHYQPTSLA